MIWYHDRKDINGINTMIQRGRDKQVISSQICVWLRKKYNSWLSHPFFKLNYFVSFICLSLLDMFLCSFLVYSVFPSGSHHSTCQTSKLTCFWKMAWEMSSVQNVCCDNVSNSISLWSYSVLYFKMGFIT